MLRLMQIEEINDLLLLVPDLVRQQEQRSTDFATNASQWLASFERVLTECRLYQAGSVSVLRSGLIGAAQGQVPAGIEFRGHASRSRVLNAAASQALQRAAELASTLMAENRPRIAEAEQVAQQVVAVALSRELITARDRDMTSTEYLRMIRRNLATCSDLENGFLHLEGLVGPNDSLILLDRALSPHLGIT